MKVSYYYSSSTYLSPQARWERLLLKKEGLKYDPGSRL